MKRVLQVVSTLENGGMEKVVMNYFAHMDHEKVMFDFLVLYGNQCRYRAALEAQGCRVFCLKNSPSDICRHSKELKSFFREHRYPVVHIHAMSSLRYRIAKQAKKNGTKTVIYHSHTSSNSNSMPLRALHRICRRKINRWSDEKYACSRTAGDYMYTENYTLIPNAIDLNRFAYSEEKRNLLREQMQLRDRFVIGHIGRYVDLKNQKFLLNVARYLTDTSFVMLFFGWGIGKADLEKQIAALNLQDRVLLMGSRDNIEEYYNIFDVLAFPSKYEGLSLVLVEAQANGCPVVASDRVSTESKLTERFSFLSIEETEVQYKNWAELLKRYVGSYHTDTKEELSRAGYNIEAEARKLQDFYLGNKDI